MANIEGFQDYSITAKIWILHFLLTSFINQTLGSTDVTSNWTSPEFNVTEQSVVTTVEDNGTTVTTATYISTAETTESEVLTTSGGALTTEGQDTSPPLGVIIGGAVAGVVGIAILVVIIIVLLKWRNKLSCCQKKTHEPVRIAPSISTVNFNEGLRVNQQISCTSETELISGSGSSTFDIQYSCASQPDLIAMSRENASPGGPVKFTLADEEEERLPKKKINTDKENVSVQNPSDIQRPRKHDAGYDVLPRPRPTGSDSIDALHPEHTKRPDDIYDTNTPDTYDISIPIGDTYDINPQNDLGPRSAETLKVPPLKKAPTYANLTKLQNPGNQGGLAAGTTEIILPTKKLGHLEDGSSDSSSSINSLEMSKVHDNANEAKNGSKGGRGQDELNAVNPKNLLYTNFESMDEFETKRNS